jgi:conjugal transfer ATP-binding protein TraC
METYRRIGEKHKRYPYMSDFLDVAGAMVKQNEPMARKMLTKIKNYTKEGAYPMFDQDTNIDTTNDVILTDLKGLEAEPQLQMIYTLLISQLYNDKMYFVKDRRKLIVRDEAWSLMQNERARRYFVEDLRTARKNGFATIAISQLPTDYLQPNPADGRAIISNFQVNIFCKFSTDSICREVGQEYNLGPEIVEEMKSLGVQKEIQEDGSFKPTYAKFMMVMGKSVYILKNLLHPFEYALYSSSAEDNAIIDYYMRVTKTYSNLEDVLWVIAQNKHIGDNDLATFLDEAGYKNMARRVRRQK